MNDTQRIKGIVMGMALGDGHLAKSSRSVNAHMKLQHTEKQRDYVAKKAMLLSELTSVAVREIEPRLPKNPNVEIAVTTKVHPLYTRAHKVLYGSGRKLITKAALAWLTPEGIAIWYMDDGSLTKSYRTGSTGAKYIANRTLWLNCNAHDISEQEILIDYFKDRHDIEFKIQLKSTHKGKKYYSLRCNATNAVKFIELISPYIVPSMQYKIDMEYTYSTKNSAVIRTMGLSADSKSQSELG